MRRRNQTQVQSLQPDGSLLIESLIARIALKPATPLGSGTQERVRPISSKAATYPNAEVQHSYPFSSYHHHPSKTSIARDARWGQGPTQFSPTPWLGIGDHSPRPVSLSESVAHSRTSLPTRLSRLSPSALTTPGVTCDLRYVKVCEAIRARDSPGPHVENKHSRCPWPPNLGISVSKQNSALHRHDQGSTDRSLIPTSITARASIEMRGVHNERDTIPGLVRP